MKLTFMRRGVAAVAAASLITIGAPVVASASAVEACALGTICEGALSGSLGDSPFQIVMPEKFNGTVLVYSHGYRVATPIPAALAVPLGLNTNAYKPISTQRLRPHLGQVWRIRRLMRPMWPQPKLSLRIYSLRVTR